MRDALVCLAETSSNYMFDVRPQWLRWDYSFYGATLTASARRGTFWIDLNTTEGLSVGDAVVLQMASSAPETVNRFLAPHSLHDSWRPQIALQDPDGGIVIDEKHVVAEISGLRVRLREPILVTVVVEEDWTLQPLQVITGVGFEDICVLNLECYFDRFPRRVVRRSVSAC